jgi:hypothetical protein
METEIERAFRLAQHLPGVESAEWYGTPALKVAGKGFARLKEPGVLVVMCPIELKDLLMEAEPALYFQTPHYEGYAAMLVRLDAIDDDRLKDRIACAWREKAPRKLLKQLESGTPC